MCKKFLYFPFFSPYFNLWCDQGLRMTTTNKDKDEKERVSISISTEAANRIDKMAAKYGIRRGPFVIQAAMEKVEKLEKEELIKS
jgi:hypothetical protein